MKGQGRTVRRKWLSREFLSILGALFLSWVVTIWWLYKRKYNNDRLKETSNRMNVDKSSSKNYQQLIENSKSYFDYERFATSPKEFKAWFDYLFDISPFPAPITSAIVGFFVFLIGLILSLNIKFEKGYTQTPAIYIGCFGIAWVLWVLRKASLTVHEALEDLRPCFLVDDEEYKYRITFWLSKMISHSGNFLYSILFFVIALIVVYIGLFRPDITQKINIRSLRPVFFFPPYWFTDDNLQFKAVILSFYGLCVALPLGTSFRLMLLNILFLLDIQKFPVIPAPNIIRSRLRSLTNLYVFISGSWFIGVALFGAVFFKTLDAFSALFIGILSLLGIMIFLAPQIILIRYLNRSYRLVCDLNLQVLNKLFGIKLREKSRRNYVYEIKVDADNLTNLANIIGATSKPEILIYDFRDFLVIISGQIISFMSVFVQSFIQK